MTRTTSGPPVPRAFNIDVPASAHRRVRRRGLGALVIGAMAALLAMGTVPAEAQTPPDQAPPTTTNALQDLVNGLLGGGTVPPPAPPTGTPTADGGAGPGPEAGTGEAVPAPGVAPADGEQV